MIAENIKKDLFFKWFNSTHGFELVPSEDGNTRDFRRQTTENGIVYIATTSAVEDLLLSFDFKRNEYQDAYVIYSIKDDPFFTYRKLAITCTIQKLQVKRYHGLFNRGENEDQTDDEPRTISHDNISGIASWSFSNKSYFHIDIFKYGIRHFWIFNNDIKRKKTKFRLPMNPSNWFIWSFYCLNDKRLNILENILCWLTVITTYPIWAISLLIAMNKPYSETSGKILIFTELQPLWYNSFIAWHYKIFKNKMIQMYGETWLNTILKIYFPTKEQETFPSVILSENLKVK